MFHSGNSSQLHIPAPSRPCSRRSLHSHLAAALFALGGGAGALLLSAPALAQDNTAVASLAKAGAGQTRSRLDLVASACVHEERRKTLSKVTPVLVNRCDYAVALSYCVDDNGSDHDCAADGVGAIDSRRLAPGASVAVADESSPLADADINWIACRADSGAVSGLSQDHGRVRGTCLVPDQAQPQPVQMAAAPELQQR
jgi:hypothetical protein